MFTDRDLLAIQTLGTLVGATGAVAAWITIFVEVRRRLAERRIALKAEYDNLFEARELFWRELREAYDAFRHESNSVPTELEGLIRAAGAPPGLGKIELTLWPTSHSSRLGPDQRAMWAFAQNVYPSRDGRKGLVTDHSSVSRDKAAEFHKARAAHAKLWNKWVQVLGTRYIARSYAAAHDQWLILSWLEIALAQWTRDRGPGKFSLFGLAKYVAKH